MKTQPSLGRKRRTRSALLQIAIWILIIPVSMLGWALGLQFRGNVHEIEEGGLYRSAQLDASSLRTLIDAHAIRTVINLRGAHAGDLWYQDEMRATTDLNVSEIDIAMSADKEPDAPTLAQLIDVLRTARKPILVHCKNGADRTGLAAAIYELNVAGRTPEEAWKQLSFYYGHFPWLGSGTAAMDRTFATVVASSQPIRP